MILPTLCKAALFISHGTILNFTSAGWLSWAKQEGLEEKQRNQPIVRTQMGQSAARVILVKHLLLSWCEPGARAGCRGHWAGLEEPTGLMVEHLNELRLMSLHNCLLSLVNDHVLLCLVHFHLVQDAPGQEPLQVVPDEHGHVLRGAEGEQQWGQRAEMTPIFGAAAARLGWGDAEGQLVTPG